MGNTGGLTRCICCHPLRTCVFTLVSLEPAPLLSRYEFSAGHGPTARCPVAPVAWGHSNLKFVHAELMQVDVWMC